MDQLVNPDGIKQRQILITIACHVGVAYIVGQEVTQQGAAQPPLCIGLGMSRNCTEVGKDVIVHCQNGILAVEL